MIPFFCCLLVRQSLHTLGSLNLETSTPAKCKTQRRIPSLRSPSIQPTSAVHICFRLIGHISFQGFTAVSLYIVVFWVMMPYNGVPFFSEEHIVTESRFNRTNFHPENGGSKFSRTLLSTYKAIRHHSPQDNNQLTDNTFTNPTNCSVSCGCVLKTDGEAAVGQCNVAYYNCVRLVRVGQNSHSAKIQTRYFLPSPRIWRSLFRTSQA